MPRAPAGSSPAAGVHAPRAASRGASAAAGIAVGRGAWSVWCRASPTPPPPPSPHDPDFLYQLGPDFVQPPPGPTGEGLTLSRESWDLMTDRLVAASAMPFSILVLPQVVQSAVSLAAGNPGQLSIISWEGYLSGLLGNMLMCTHFSGRGERSAVNVQLIGILNNMLVLCLVALASFMPAVVFAATSALVAAAVAMCTGRLAGRFTSHVTRGGGLPAWTTWQLLVGLVGLSLIPQIVGNMVMGGQLGALPCVLALLLGGAGVAVRMRTLDGRRALARTVEQLPGWAATLMFALSPLPQLLRNFVEPGSLEGLSLGTMLLALLGNSLMLPRALFTRDPVWICCTSWGMMAGWGQLLSMVIGASPVTGKAYLALGSFVSISAVLIAFVAFSMLETARHRRKTVESVWETDY